MKLPRTVRRWIGIIGALNSISDQLAEQNTLLRRIADQFAPIIPAASEADLQTTGPNFSRDHEQAALLEFMETFDQRVGRPPNEAEIEAWMDEQQYATRSSNDFLDDAVAQKH